MNPDNENITSDGTVNLNELLQITQNTAMSTAAQSQQMGLVLNKIGNIENDLAGIHNDIDNINANKRVERHQALRINKAIHARVAYLLGIKKSGGRVADECIEVDQRYRGGFISRAYHDARTHSKLGTPYSETLKADFDEVLRYIESWVPEVDGGIEGYKHYLDIRRDVRRGKNA